MMKCIRGIIVVALMGIIAGGLLGVRESSAEYLKPEWYTPVVSWICVALNCIAVLALIRNALGWNAKAVYLLGLVGAWFLPAMCAGFAADLVWAPHVMWALMLLIPSSIGIDLLVSKGVRTTPVSNI